MISRRYLGHVDLVDAATLSLVATIVQTLVITLTLIVFIFQFRSQEKAIKEASYQNLLGRYDDFIMSGQDSDNLFFARLLSQDRASLEAKDVANVRRLMISYGIMEEAYELHKKGWIDEDAREQWNTWLKALSYTPHFETLHSSTAGMFDGEFQAHVSKLLESGAESPA